jgi:Holliday junction resolvase RusA-like endonuclease
MIFRSDLVDLNTYINAERRNRFLGAKIKKTCTDDIYYECLSEENSNQQPIKTPVVIHFRWYTKNLKKDADNVSFSKKFVLDGLVKAGILPDDTRRWIGGFTDQFYVDKDNPRLEIDLDEL